MEWKTVTVTLAHPVTLGGLSATPPGAQQPAPTTITEITLREPDVEALEAIQEIDMKEGHEPTVRESRLLIEALCTCPKEAIRKLHREDFGKLAEAIVPLVSGSPEASTGET